MLSLGLNTQLQSFFSVINNQNKPEPSPAIKLAETNLNALASDTFEKSPKVDPSTHVGATKKARFGIRMDLPAFISGELEGLFSQHSVPEAEQNAIRLIKTLRIGQEAVSSTLEFARDLFEDEFFREQYNPQEQVLLLKGRGSKPSPAGVRIDILPFEHLIHAIGYCYDNDGLVVQNENKYALKEGYDPKWRAIDLVVQSKLTEKLASNLIKVPNTNIKSTLQQDSINLWTSPVDSKIVYLPAEVDALKAELLEKYPWLKYETSTN